MTYLCIGLQALHEALFPVDFLENNQTLPSLTRVVRPFLVIASEEQSGTEVAEIR